MREYDGVLRVQEVHSKAVVHMYCGLRIAGTCKVTSITALPLLSCRLSAEPFASEISMYKVEIINGGSADCLVVVAV